MKGAALVASCCVALGCSVGGPSDDAYLPFDGGDDGAEGNGYATLGADWDESGGLPGGQWEDESGGDSDGTSDGADDGEDGDGSDDGPQLPDLDCDPQPPWYIPGDPIQTDPTQYGQWRWIDVPGMVCADGSQGGFFASFTDDDRDLVIFFGGGGVCYDPISCLFDTPLLLGMGPFPLATWLGDQQSHSGIFDRNDPSNPLRNANFAYFPHCTGDGHTADKISSYPPLQPSLRQKGYGNVQRAMTVIAPTFEDIERVTVAGFSAGGIGSLANYHQIAWLWECLGHPPPLLIDDAGPVMRKPYLSDLAQSSLKTGWGLDATFDDLCAECGTQGYHLALEKIRELHPGVRTSLVNAYNDGVVSDLYAALTLDFAYVNDPGKLRAGLLDYAAWTAGMPDGAEGTRHREFFYGGDRHGALVVAPLSETPGLAQFLQAQLDDAPDWSSVH